MRFLVVLMCFMLKSYKSEIDLWLGQIYLVIMYCHWEIDGQIF